MNIDKYKMDFANDIMNRWKQSKELFSRKKALALKIRIYFNTYGLNIKKFLENKELIDEIILTLDNKELKKQFESYLKEFNLLSFHKEKITNDMNNGFTLLVDKIVEYFSGAKTYGNITDFVNTINKISDEFVVINNGFITFLKRIGFSEEEIIEFLGIVAKENIKVCNKRMDTLDKEEQAKRSIEEAKLAKKEERERKKNLLNKKMSDETAMLLNGIGNLFEDEKTDFDENILNMALAYEDILIGDITFDLEDLKKIKDIDKYIFVLIWKTYNDIIALKNEKTEEELKSLINKLRMLYSNMLVMMEEDKKYEDSESEDLVKPKESIVIKYVIDEKTDVSYFDIAINKNKGDSDFERNARSIINKGEKGLLVARSKRPINDIPDGYFVLAGKTYVSFIMLNEESYIILTASKWDDLFTESRNIYNTNIDQIRELKKDLVGDKYE